MSKMTDGKMKKMKLIYSIEDKRQEKANDMGIFFIHGATGSNQVWKKQIDGLSSLIKVVALNLPGHLGSEGPEIPTIETYIAALDKIIRQLQLNKVILAGHSMGGAIILSYYLQYPHKVDALILIGTGARLRVMPMILKSIQTNYTEYIKWSSQFAFHKSTLKNNRDLVKELERNMMQILPQIAYSDFKICDEFDIMERLNEIKVPTLIIVGENDQLTPIKYSKYMHDRIENSELHIIGNAVHMVMLERGEQVNHFIWNFLERIA